MTVEPLGTTWRMLADVEGDDRRLTPAVETSVEPTAMLPEIGSSFALTVSSAPTSSPESTSAVPLGAQPASARNEPTRSGEAREIRR